MRNVKAKQYLSLFRIRFTNGLQYRAAALAGVATQYAWGFMELLAFAAFYRANPAAFPMAFSQTVTYIWLQQAFLALFAVWVFDNSIFDAIMSGDIAYELVRPTDLYARWFCQSAATRLSRAVLRCLPILLVAAVLPGRFRMGPPASGAAFVLFLLSAVLALCVVVSFSMIIYALTFYTLSPVGLRTFATLIADFLAGGIVPLPFFPDGVRGVVELLPFAAMQNMPLRVYSAHIAGRDALYGILLQVFWLAAMGALGKALMNRALRKVIVQGG